MKFITSRNVGRLYYKFQIGFAPISYLLTFIGFLTFAKVWQNTFDYFNIPFAITLVLFPLGILSIAVIIGELMVRKNVQEEMTSIANTEANKEFLLLIETIDRLEDKIDKMVEKV
jgi:hypothetical protein